MPKKNGRRYTDAQRAAILADIEKNGLTQVAAAKKYRVSAVTIWKWRRDATQASRTHRRRGPTTRSNGTLVAMVRADVNARVREMLTGIVAEEVARALGPIPRLK